MGAVTSQGRNEAVWQTVRLRNPQRQSALRITVPAEEQKTPRQVPSITNKHPSMRLDTHNIGAHRIVAYQKDCRLTIDGVATEFKRRELQYLGKYNASATTIRTAIWTDDIVSTGYINHRG